MNGSLELARSLRKVENHAPTNGGKHILLSRRFASPKRVRWPKSCNLNNLIISKGGGASFWKCKGAILKNYEVLIGENIIFEIAKIMVSRMLSSPFVGARFLSNAKTRFSRMLACPIVGDDF